MNNGASSPDTGRERFELHLDVEQGGLRAATLLSDASGLSRAAVKAAMNKGAVWIGRGGNRPRRLRRGSHQPESGDRLHLYYDHRILAAVPPPPTLLADREGYSVWYKPPGLFSQGSRWGDHCTLHRWVEQHLEPPRPALVVHRLDRAARGIMLVAHGKRVASALADLFRKRQVEKHYTALVHGRFPETPLTIDSPIGGRPARSHARRLDYAPETDRSLLEIRIETGRKHQIRRHLQQAGHPIVGDRLYGRRGDREDLQLLSSCLSFLCPIRGQRVMFELPRSLLDPGNPDNPRPPTDRFF